MDLSGSTAVLWEAATSAVAAMGLDVADLREIGEVWVLKDSASSELSSFIEHPEPT